MRKETKADKEEILCIKDYAYDRITIPPQHKLNLCCRRQEDCIRVAMQCALSLF